MRRLHAYIDEAGHRSTTARSSAHFVMAAVVIDESRLADVADRQAQLRKDLNRQPHHALHWQNIKGHFQRVHAAWTLGSLPVTVSAVVVCKRFLEPTLPDEHHAYLYTFRMLLERLSWLAQDEGAVLEYTLAHIVRFKLSRLRAYEAKLRSLETALKWAYLDPDGGRIEQPNRVEQLQLADIAASATYRAFEPEDRYGYTERRYLEEFAQRLYCRPGKALSSYGLKIHPREAKAAYPWVTALR
jgi:hypothetical protein